jgi:tRNA nucleotidyltransferase/poly(A) polymerase
MGLTHLDVDLATSASPDQVELLFEDAEVQAVGRQFGVVLVDGIEVASFRGEKYVIPGKPEIQVVASFEEDASRRDFTINAMAMDQYGKILDPFHGRADLEQKLIRAVGDPEMRFREDPIRILRGIGFAVRFGFELEANTQAAMLQSRMLLMPVPKIRIGKEVQKMLKAKCLASGLRLMEKLELLPIILPQLGHLPLVEQNPKYHHLNAWEHSLAVLEYIEQLPKDTGSEDLAWAALFHDCGKGLPGIRAYHSKSKMPSDHGHDEKSTALTDEVLTEWAVSKQTKHLVLFLVRHHMLMPASASADVLVTFLNDLANDFSSIGELQAYLEKLYWIKMADIHGKALFHRSEDVQHLREIWRRLEIVAAKVPFFRYQTSIQASDFKETGEDLGLRLRQQLLEEQISVLKSTDWQQLFGPANKGDY